jgi:hypothetical protein
MKSAYSKEPQFKAMPPSGSPIYNMVMRVISVGQGEEIHVIGTCVSIAEPLVITARHVAVNILERQGAKTANGETIINGSIWIVRITNDDDLYAVWEVESVWLCPYSDIAMMHLKPYNEEATRQRWYNAALDLIPPQEGSRVFGFGFNMPETKVTIGEDGTRHIVTNDTPTTTVGEVTLVHHERGNNSTRNFPCYEVNFLSKPGMSGAPVFNDSGRLCGLICSGMEFPPGDNGAHVSFVTTLWPMMGTILNAGRSTKYPRGVFYPALELAQDGLIAAFGWERVFFNPATNDLRLLALPS